LLNRKFPGILQTRKTILRAIIPSTPLAMGIYWLVEGPVLSGRSVLVQAGSAAGLMTVGFMIVLPFIWRDVKSLLKLGEVVASSQAN
ncbi:MAG: hypothetical protein P8046_09435, partial [Anaerolineales bacterium]